jgi:cytoskeletal protein CcmA (bactofilin family)
MSCFPEAVYSVYIDGELPPQGVRDVDAHLVRCRDCRSLVLALREEGTLLADALLERDHPAYRNSARPAPARGLAIGLIPSLAAVGLVVAVVGWILESLLPSSMTWLNPLNLIGAYQMAFDLIFLIRNQAPGLVELVIAVAATVSVSALLSFGLSAVARRLSGSAALGLLLAAFLWAPAPGSALVLRDEEQIRVGPGEVLEETLIAAAETVLVEGVVDGDLVVLTERLVIRGEIRGNVYGLIRNLELDGRVAGSLHVCSERIVITGEVGGNVWSASENLTLGDNGRVARDLSSVASGVVIDGEVGRDLFAGGEYVEIRGGVTRNVQTRSERITLFDGASIGGDFELHLPENRKAAIDPGATIGGELREIVDEHPLGEEHSRFFTIAFYLRAVVLLAAMFLVGMALHATVPWIFDNHLETAGDFFHTLGYGFVALIAAPVILILTFLTIVGIPIAIIGLWVFITTMFLSGIVVAALIGRALLRSVEKSATGFGLALLLGLCVLLFSGAIPFVGFLLHVLILLTGLGLLVDRGLSALRESRRAIVP